MKQYETKHEVDDAITEIGYRAVAAGLHRKGKRPTQMDLEAARIKPRHECTWVEDESGAEPPFDFCISCGKRRY